MESPATTRIPLSALGLGLGGLLPFFLLSALLHVSPQPDLKFFFGRSLVAYSAVILSFLGGTRWGLALRAVEGRKQALHLVVAVLPSIAAWLLSTARVDTAIAGFAILFAILGLADVLTLKSLLAPAWYGRLRTVLSVMVVISLVSAMFAVT